MHTFEAYRQCIENSSKEGSLFQNSIQVLWGGGGRRENIWQSNQKLHFLQNNKTCPGLKDRQQ